MIRRLLVRILVTLGLTFLLGLVSVIILVIRLQPDVPQVPDRAVIELDLRTTLVEPGEAARIQPLGRDRPQLHRVVSALRHAAEDDRVLAVVARVDGSSQSLFASQDLHEALAKVHEAGKPTFVHADTFGEVGNGTAGYFLASGFEEIWLQPVGLVGLTGVSASMPFVADALEVLGIEPHFSRRTTYKTAMDHFTEAEIRAPHREMMESLLDDLYTQIVDTVAAGRGLDPEEVEAWIDRAPLTADEAHEAGLVDHVRHADELRTHVSERFDNDFEWVNWRRYDVARLAELDVPDEPRFALVHGTGQILRGESTADPLSGNVTIGADTFAAAVDQAIEDEVDALIVRISSPGGSAVASETARRALARAREADIPVVVSIGSEANSGGYWIAIESDHIVARPAALTGSIGVLAGKFSTAGLWDRLHVNWDTVSRGENVDMFSMLDGFSESGQERLDHVLDSIYQEFRVRVADGRELNLATVDELARGRVWTGQQALDNGLIDELGGLHEAANAARRLADIDPDIPVRLQVYPPPKTPLQQLLELLSGEGPLALGISDRRQQLQAISGPIAAWLGHGNEATRVPFHIEGTQGRQ